MSDIIATVTQFKGRPVLALKSGDEDKYPFQFGVSKARKILAALPAIQKFVDEADKAAEA